jgi:tetratricopeptide (TPR) repeat protein
VAAGRVLTALSAVHQRLGDPRQEEAIVEALALLEAQPPGRELVAAHAQLAAKRCVGSAYPEAIAAAEQALALASELGLPEPARAVGAQGYARCHLGERQGLEDMRRALQLALDQGQGRAAAVLHNNLAVVSWLYEGPQAALAACREGIDFSERRGIAEIALAIANMSASFVAQLGQPEEALAEAEPLAERLQAAGDVFFTEPRALQLRLLAERGARERAPNPDELVASARESGEPQLCAIAFTAAARLHLAQGHPQEVQALLAELEQVPRIRAEAYYASVLPEVVRTALARAAGARSPARRRRRTTHAALRARAPRLPSPARRSRRRPRPGCRRLRRGFRALAAVRQRPRTRLRPARPGPLSVDARRARGGAAAARGARGVRIDGLQARARGNRGAARSGRGRCRVETAGSTCAGLQVGPPGWRRQN